MRPIVLAILLTAAAPALAGEPPAPAPPSPVSTVADEAREDDADTVDRHCLRETGSRIRHRDGRRRCSAFSGRVWTRDDLARTGHVDLASALRTLDVSIR